MDETYTSYAKRILPDGRICEVVPLTYGRARIVVGNAHDPYTVDVSY